MPVSINAISAGKGNLRRRWMLGIASKLTKLVSLHMGCEIGKQSGKRHGANEDQKDPHWPPPYWRRKRRQ